MSLMKFFKIKLILKIVLLIGLIFSSITIYNIHKEKTYTYIIYLGNGETRKFTGLCKFYIDRTGYATPMCKNDDEEIGIKRFKILDKE